MSDAVPQVLEDAAIVTFNLLGPKLEMLPMDEAAYAVNKRGLLCQACDRKTDTWCRQHLQPSLAPARAVRVTIEQIVGSAFQGQMGGGLDELTWAGWLTVLKSIDDEGRLSRPNPFEVKVSIGMVRWLRDLIKPELKTPYMMAQYRHALTKYLGTLLDPNLLALAARVPAIGNGQPDAVAEPAREA